MATARSSGRAVVMCGAALKTALWPAVKTIIGRNLESGESAGIRTLDLLIKSYNNL
jgi:hypothetical protein